jgi:aspartate-semialdehyde dehydrogenase
VVVSTYQSVSGSGLATDWSSSKVSDPDSSPRGAIPPQIDLNVIPQGGDFLPDGTTTEEAKLVFETRKILKVHQPLAVTATVVSVPVMYGPRRSGEPRIQ